MVRSLSLNCAKPLVPEAMHRLGSGNTATRLDCQGLGIASP